VDPVTINTAFALAIQVIGMVRQQQGGALTDAQLDSLRATSEAKLKDTIEAIDQAIQEANQ